MSLQKEIEAARKKIISDGYEMSFGELMSLYRDGEIRIHPEFQRLFRWDITQKSRFIESLLLGIPIPPIFVFVNDDGTWDLIDGLQRLSTVFEFAGILKEPGSDRLLPPSILEKTKLLPNLYGATWKSKTSDTKPISSSDQLTIKRARVRVEILKRESNPLAKFELFQRLNTGGSGLTPQEVRRCLVVMLSPSFAKWMDELAEYDSFVKATSLSEKKEQKQANIELVVRFLVYRHISYDGKLDVHPYLDEGVVLLASSEVFDREKERKIFQKSFDLIHETLGESAFKRHDGQRFSGQFLISAFEAIAVGVSTNLNSIQKQKNPAQFIRRKAEELWKNNEFKESIGAGVRGTTRLHTILPFAKKFFRPT